MKRLIIITTSIFYIIMLFSCKKDEIHCSNAELCIKNIGNDTIYFCWGCNFYEDSILPGDKACKNVGEIKIDRTTEHTSVAYFNSTRGNYAIRVDECKEEKEID